VRSKLFVYSRIKKAGDVRDETAAELSIMFIQLFSYLDWIWDSGKKWPLRIYGRNDGIIIFFIIN